MSCLFLCYPKCGTCKKAKAWLDEKGVSYTFRDITKENPTEAEDVYKRQLLARSL